MISLSEFILKSGTMFSCAVILILCVQVPVSPRAGSFCLQPKCKPNPSESCTKIYKPVCGSDGKTYSNECTLRAANQMSEIPISIQKFGECDQPQEPKFPIMCPMNYSPVCGSDGKTYGNECTLRAANQGSKTTISIQKQGECDQPQEPNYPIMCPMNYSPVCGSDGKTYSNECTLRAANQMSEIPISIQKQGECDQPQEPNSPIMCPMNYSPVCGSDGKTYGNECTLRAANQGSKTTISIQKQGECDQPQEPKFPIMCPMNYSPVCGSDGKTYSNECTLRAANQMSEIPISIQKLGECDQPQEPIMCPMNYSPVCGSDGKTYGNECTLRAANQGSKTTISIQKQGECDQPQEPKFPNMCPMNYSPVCGSDGKTYVNECTLRAANQGSKTTISIQKQGECEQPDCSLYSPDICPLNYSPVCGSNGKTYGNECMLCAAIKMSTTPILIQKQGECD